MNFLEFFFYFFRGMNMRNIKPFNSIKKIFQFIEKIQTNFDNNQKEPSL